MPVTPRSLCVLGVLVTRQHHPLSVIHCAGQEVTVTGSRETKMERKVYKSGVWYLLVGLGTSTDV